MTALTIRPFVKWAGGKSRVIPDLSPFLPEGDCLVEPFVGGASVFLATNYRRYVLGDINPDLINLYQMVKRYPDHVIKIARTLFADHNNPQRYSAVRDDFNQYHGRIIELARRTGSTHRRILRAAMFLYLNRHCYNGLCRYSQKTGFNVPYGHYRNVYFPEHEIYLFSEKANDTKAIFVHAPFQVTLRLVTGNNFVIYCDPPYLPESDTASFTQYHTEPFTPDNHRHLVRELLEINREYGAPVVISNSDTAATREIYQPFTLHRISVQRSVGADAGSRRKAGELIGVLPAGGLCTGQSATAATSGEYDHVITSGY